MDSSGYRQTVWLAQAGQGEHRRLDADIEVDVCIVGGGIVGLSAGYELTRAGFSVAVLEDGAIGSGETGRSTAHLSFVLDDGFTNLERWFGVDGAAAAAASHRLAVDRLEAICRAERIACGFERVDGFLFLGPDQDFSMLQEEAAAAGRAGLAFTWSERAPISGVDTGRCLLFPDQAQFHPVRYLIGLADRIVALGGRIFGWTHVNGLESDGERVTATTTHGPRVRARHAIVATNTPVIDRFSTQIRQTACHTYVVALRAPAGAIRKALYWDMLDPYHYVRSAPDEAGGELLIVGGEDHRAGQADPDPDGRFDRLEAWARRLFPEAAETVYRWSGQIQEPAEGLSYIGRSPGDGANVLIATGDGGHGITHAMLAGMILTDLIRNRPNPFAALYDPGRRSVPGGCDLGRVVA